MLLTRLACVALAVAVGGSPSWPDCGDEQGNETGPLGQVVLFNQTYDGTIFYVVHPQDLSQGHFPVVVFMHGLTGTYGMYHAQVEFYASHGFVVFFPFVVSPSADARTFPPVTNTDGKYMVKGVHFAQDANRDPASPLYNKLDLGNVALNGHSMGATCVIEAAKTLPAGTVKVAVAQHPGVCGPFGPPPLPSTWMPSDMEEVNAKMPLLMTTATNDGAFWPAPLTAEHELGCFHKVRPNTTMGLAFAQFSEAACLEDQQRQADGYPDGGHNCPLKIPSPETPWAWAAIKLYTQLGGSPASRCYAKLWGDGAESMQKASTVEQSVVHAPQSPGLVI